MRKMLAAIAVIVLGFSLIPSIARAQEASQENVSVAAKLKPVQPYRLDFSFNELADGKTINTRRYSMNLTAGQSNEIKIGTRVPVASGINNANMPSQYQYLDVGTNIWAQLREHGDELILAVRAENSSLDIETGQHVGAFAPPIIRQIKIDGDTLLVTGKPIMIGSVDDPNSKRQFQLEVTVTRLK